MSWRRCHAARPQGRADVSPRPARARALRRRARARGRPAPQRRPAAGLHRRCRRGRPGHDRLRRAERGRGPDGRRRAPGGADGGRAHARGRQAAGHRQRRDDPRDRRDRPRRRPLGDHGAGRGARPGNGARDRAADGHRRDRVRGHPQPAGQPFGLRRRARGARGDRRAALGAAVGRGSGSLGEVAQARVTVECPDLCPRFTARVFESVTIGPSPLWLAARLLAAGMRPISNVVDITNYVMLLTGQPLHAFDLDRVAGAQLTVRRARAGETLEALDGVTDTLSEDMVVICDDDGPTSLAGVMGGARSEVGPGTTRVLLEAATWDSATVQRTSVALGRRSEASARFEKGLSRLSPLEGQIVASALFTELCGARLLPGTIDVGGPGPEPPPITLRPARLERAGRRDPAAALPGDPHLPGLRGRRGPAGDGPALPPRRRDARDRPDRGGRADRGPGPAARHAAPAHRRGRTADPRPARAPPRRGRARRARPVRDRRLDVHRSRRARPPAPPRRTSDAPDALALQPAVGDALDAAPDAALLAARRGRPQRGAWRVGARALRVGSRVPCGRRGAPRTRGAPDRGLRAVLRRESAAGRDARRGRRPVGGRALRRSVPASRAAPPR